MTWTVEISEEVATWYHDLSPEGQAATDRAIERLEAQGNQLRMPHSKALGEGLCELRFTCESLARRITYVFEPNRHAITLTTFRKQRQNERAQILRARRAQAQRAETTAEKIKPERGKSGRAKKDQGRKR